MVKPKIQSYTYKHIVDAVKVAELAMSKAKDKEIKELREEKDIEIARLKKENNCLRKEKIETLEKEVKTLRARILKNSKKVNVPRHIIAIGISSISVISIMILYFFKIIGLEEIKLLIDAVLRIFLG